MLSGRCMSRPLSGRVERAHRPALQSAFRQRRRPQGAVTGVQPQDRQGPRPDDPAVAPAAGGPGDRVGQQRNRFKKLASTLQWIKVKEAKYREEERGFSRR